MAEAQTTADAHDKLRKLILNVRKPIVIHNFEHNWSTFNCNLEEWCKKFDEGNKNNLQTFSCMTKHDTAPQWERKHEFVKITAMQYLKACKSEQKFWTGLNYKRAHDMPNVCTEGISFDCFGFPDSEEDVNFWLSSPGANTPCHYDAFGCNIVVQVYGSKSWLLFPPETPLTTTRIPYEESSIYCLENFHSPNLQHMIDFQQFESFAHKCILNPGDVLIVPNHWWHYAETIENSLSVNYWVKLKKDFEAQLEECIVKYIIENLVKELLSPEAVYVFNPNQFSEITDDEELWTKFKWLLDTAAARDAGYDDDDVPKCYDYQYLTQQEIDDLITNFPNISEVPQMSSNSYMDYISDNAKRYDEIFADTESPLNKIKEIMLNSICSPNAIKLIKCEFYRRYATELAN